jgi:CPA1 family monovalent cation:H+ antiporter
MTQAGAPFPERELVVFLAAATIMLTLVLNGIPLPWLIRKLRPPSDAIGMPEENACRAEIARAGIAAVQPALATLTDPDERAFAQQLIHRYEDKIALREAPRSEAAARAERISTARRLRLVAIAAERERLYELHARDAINDETLRVIEEELDERELLSSAGPLRG